MPIKERTRKQVEAMQAKAVRFLRDVVGDDAKADDFEDMSVEDYARHKHITLKNPGGRRATKCYPDKCLPKKDFAYVGDPRHPTTWALRVDNKNHVRDAMARFSRTKKIPKKYRHAVALELHRIAKRMKIDDRNFYAKYVARKRNPDGALADAENLYSKFHGSDPREIIEMQFDEQRRGTYTALGELYELRFKAPNKSLIKLGFEGNLVKLASSPDGKQLYLIGGDQVMDEKLIRQFGEDPSKDYIPLGQALFVSYVTRKRFDHFQQAIYEHKLGEEGGHPPEGFYDRLNQTIILAGGSYHVAAPGIIN